jgi:signal transduction histidine kinase/ActR/RegA family two-component response regulator
VVLAQLPGRWIQIQDGDVSLRVLGGSGAPTYPGRQIEAVGYLNRKGGRMILREAVYRDIGEGRLPAPQPFAGTLAEAVSLDGQLVTASGLLLSRILPAEETRMTLHSPAGLFAVTAEHPVASGLPLQSQITVTGLMDISYDEQGQPTSFRVRLRSSDDVVLVQRPSWLTRGRMLALATALGLGVGLALLWVAALRRRVHRQTGQIREQMQREAHLEAELQRATRLESLGLLAGGIAHDFNNLLTIIIGNLSMASLGKTVDREVRDNVLAASRATMRARDLTQQLLTFAKGGSPVRSTLALPELVRDVTEFVLRGSAVDCEFRFMPGLWPAHADKGQISQVVQNLVINAVQAMPEGGHVHLTLANDEIAADESRVLAPGRYLRLEISDTGAGIAPDVLPRIFDPYFTTKQTGSGIGLATVYSIARKHGGHITVDSALGVGTTFRLWLPASNSAPDAAPPPEADTNAASLSGRVLLMDDEADIRALASQMMQHLGLYVHCVADGTAAVDEYSRALRDSRRYDLVVLDLTVPGGLGGLQALRRLRAIDPDVVAVVSSGYSADEVMASYRSHGFRAMVPKPYGIEELARALRPLLSSQPGAN